MPQFEDQGLKIGYLEMGPEDAPLALFAHCSLAFSGLWKGVMSRLSDRWRCVALDMPGHGASDRGDRDLSLQMQAVRYVEAAAARWGGGPAHLVGVSLGGAVMGRVAHARPDLTRTLTMIEPVYYHLIADVRPDAVAEESASMTEVNKAIAERRFRDGARAFMEAWGQPGQFDRFPEPAKVAVARALEFVSEDFPMIHGSPPGQITRADFAAMDHPILLIHGARTQPSAIVVLDELAAATPQAERTEIANAGHLSPLDDPEAVARRLAAFFAAAEAG